MAKLYPRRLLIQLIVRLQRQKFFQFIVGYDFAQPAGRSVVITALKLSGADCVPDFFQFLFFDPTEKLNGYLTTVVQHALGMVHPLPQLRARDFGRGGVFHQMIDGNATGSRGQEIIY